MSKRILLFFFLSALSFTALAQSEIIFDNVDELMLIGPKVDYFTDSSNQLEMDDILKKEIQQQFKKSTNTIFVHPTTTSNIWLRIKIKNTTSEDIWLNAAYFSTTNIDFYTPSIIQNKTPPVRVGAARPVKNKMYPVTGYWLPLNSKDSTSFQTYYIKLNTSAVIELPLMLGTLKTLHQRQYKDDMLGWFFVGVMAIMFLYNLFIYFFTKDSIYLYYIFYILTVLLVNTYNSNLNLVQYIGLGWIPLAWWEDYVTIWFGVAFMAIGLFCINFLRLKERLTWGYWLVLVQMLVLSVVFPVLNLIVGVTGLVDAYEIIVLLYLLSCMLVGIVLRLRKDRNASLYVLGWTAVFISAFVHMATFNGLLPFYTITRHAAYIGYGLEVWFFSIALADRIRILRRNNEELLLDQKEKLELQVQQRTEEVIAQAESLEKQAKELNALNQTKDRFFAIIAHDLRSPMVAFRGINRQIKYFIKKQEPEKLQSVAQNIEQSSHNLEHLLDNLLNWAMNQKEILKPQIKDFDLHNLAQELLEHFTLSAQNDHISLINQIPEKTLLQSDQNMVLTILRNLISNALKFTPENGKISIEYEQNNTQERISVTDTGIGMPQEKANTLFKGLKLDQETGVRGEKGAGIGLRLCFELATILQVKLEVKSTEGKGSTFSIVKDLK